MEVFFLDSQDPIEHDVRPGERATYAARREDAQPEQTTLAGKCGGRDAAAQGDWACKAILTCAMRLFGPREGTSTGLYRNPEMQGLGGR